MTDQTLVERLRELSASWSSGRYEDKGLRLRASATAVLLLEAADALTAAGQKGVAPSREITLGEAWYGTEPVGIDCPACGETVKQIASATLSLALWQHWNWVCPKRDGAVARKCPSCGSPKQERIAGLWLCNACGHEWGQEGAAPSPQSTEDKTAGLLSAPQDESHAVGHAPIVATRERLRFVAPPGPPDPPPSHASVTHCPNGHRLFWITNRHAVCDATGTALCVAWELGFGGFGMSRRQLVAVTNPTARAYAYTVQQAIAEASDAEAVSSCATKADTDSLSSSPPTAPSPRAEGSTDYEIPIYEAIGRYAVKSARWIRHEHEHYAAVPVAFGANLESQGMRFHALKVAALGEPPAGTEPAGEGAAQELRKQRCINCGFVFGPTDARCSFGRPDQSIGPFCERCDRTIKVHTGFEGAAQEPPPQSTIDVERRYREELWLNHGHTGLYGDDGEMQCSRCSPTWDYKRAPLVDVMAAASQARMERAAKAWQEYEARRATLAPQEPPRAQEREP